MSEQQCEPSQTKVVLVKQKLPPAAKRTSIELGTAKSPDNSLKGEQRRKELLEFLRSEEKRLEPAFKKVLSATKVESDKYYNNLKKSHSAAKTVLTPLFLAGVGCGTAIFGGLLFAGAIASLTGGAAVATVAATFVAGFAVAGTSIGLGLYLTNRITRHIMRTHKENVATTERAASDYLNLMGHASPVAEMDKSVSNVGKLMNVKLQIPSTINNNYTDHASDRSFALSYRMARKYGPIPPDPTGSASERASDKVFAHHNFLKSAIQILDPNNNEEAPNQAVVGEIERKDKQ